MKVSAADVGVPVTLMGGRSREKSSEGGGACYHGRCVAIGRMFCTVAPLIHEDGELKMKFKLVTRKGHKAQVRHVTVT